MASRLDFSQIRSLYIGTSSSTTVDTNNLIVVGSVGIGTTAPGSKLQVEGANPFIRVNNTSADDHGIKISYNGSDAHGLHLLYNANSAVSYIDNTYQAVSGQVYGNIYIRQNVGGTMTSRITIKADGGNVGIGTTSPATRLDVSGGVTSSGSANPYFALNNGTAVSYLQVSSCALNVRVGGANPIIFTADSSELMRITSAGNVGIGTTAPATKLHVEDSTPILTIKGTGSGEFGLKISDGSSNTAGITYSSVTGEQRIIGAQSYVFQTIYSGGSERVRITTDGNVGIGTTAPGYKLDISGGSATSRRGFSSPRFSSTGEYNYGVTNSPTWNVNQGAYTNNNATSPDGTTTAGTYTLTTVSWDLYQNMPVTAGVEYTVGMWVKLGTATNFCIVVNNTLAWNTIGGKAFDSSDGLSTSKWTHISYTFTGPANGSINLHIGAHSESGVPQQTAGTVFLWNWEMSLLSSTWIGKVDDEIRLPGSSIWTSRGNVGIGTTAPSNKLTVYQGGGVRVTGISAGDYIELSGNLPGYADNTYPVIKSNGSIHFANNGKYAAFLEGANTYFGILDNTTTTRVFLATSGNTYFTGGNVGIGTTGPGVKLDVSSDIRTATRYLINTGTTGEDAAFGFWDVSNLRIEGGSAKPMFITSYNGVIKLGPSGSEAMRINGAGNVGIGTTAPGARLTVKSLSGGALGIDILGRDGDSYGLLTFKNSDGTSTFAEVGGNTSTGFLVNNYVNTHTSFSTNSVERMRITSAGNVGIGVTPSNWSVITGFQVGSGASLSGYQADEALLAANTYYNSGFKYAASAYATAYQQQNGVHKWLNASSGTAGNAISFSQPMTLTNGGNLLIGTTTDSGYKLDVSGSARVNSTSNLAMFVKTNSAFGAAISYEDSTTGGNDAISAGAIGGDFYISTNYSERVRVTSGGNVGIGTTAPAKKLHVYNSGPNQGLRASNLDGVNMDVLSGANGGIVGTNSNHPLSLYTNSTEKVTITASGNVGIGTTAPQQLIHVLGATNGYAMIQGANDAGQAGIYFKKEDTTGTMDRTKGLIVFHTNVGSGWGRGHLGFCLNSSDNNTVVSVSDEKFRMVDNGDFLADGDVVAYSTTISDARYKTNIQPIESALDKVNQMRGVSFDWTAVRSGREFGVIAQEIEQIAPEVVSEKELLNGDTMKTVSYTSLVPFLIESIKELTQQVNELKAQLDGLTK